MSVERLPVTRGAPRLRANLMLDLGLELLVRAFAEQAGADSAALVLSDRTGANGRIRAAWGLGATVPDGAFRAPEGALGALLDGSSSYGRIGPPAPGDDPFATTAAGAPIRQA